MAGGIVMIISSNDSFASLVRTLRLSKNMTKAEFAHAVGKSARWVHDIESGAKEPTLSAIIATCAALGQQLLIEPIPTGTVLDEILGEL